jgi:hypothetical protein
MPAATKSLLFSIIIENPYIWSVKSWSLVPTLARPI